MTVAFTQGFPVGLRDTQRIGMASDTGATNVGKPTTTYLALFVFAWIVLQALVAATVPFVTLRTEHGIAMVVLSLPFILAFAIARIGMPAISIIGATFGGNDFLVFLIVRAALLSQLLNIGGIGAFFRAVLTHTLFAIRLISVGIARTFRKVLFTRLRRQAASTYLVYHTSPVMKVLYHTEAL